MCGLFGFRNAATKTTDFVWNEKQSWLWKSLFHFFNSPALMLLVFVTLQLTCRNIFLTHAFLMVLCLLLILPDISIFNFNSRFVVESTLFATFDIFNWIFYSLPSCFILFAFFWRLHGSDAHAIFRLASDLIREQKLDKLMLCLWRQK